MTGTASQIEWAEQIKPRVNAEFDRVARTFQAAACNQEDRIEWIVDEEIGRALLQKGKLREEATARKAKVLGGIVLVLLPFGNALYLLAVR